MIAIHNSEGGFSGRWIELCRKRRISFLEVNLFDTNLVDKLRSEGVALLLAHPPMLRQSSVLAAKNIILALSQNGIRTFPTFRDYWHFDDKIAQKYLFEAIGVPTPKTTVLFDKQQALSWILNADLPVVSKLRSGAGSTNVSLITHRSQGVARVRRMFGKGDVPTDRAFGDYRTKVRMHNAKGDWLAMLRRSPKTLASWWSLRNELNRERGYVYFQEFISGNADDIRVTVIGRRAFAFRRLVRPGDFRASGSGIIEYDPLKIDERCVVTAFEAAQKMQSSCMAFDFVRHPAHASPLVLEASFGFAGDAVARCPGYWTDGLAWIDSPMRPEDAILDDILADSTYAVS